MAKALSLNDSRFAQLYDKVALLYRVGGKLRYYSFATRPSGQKPVGFIKLNAKGKTLSEALIELNRSIENSSLTVQPISGRN